MQLPTDVIVTDQEKYNNLEDQIIPVFMMCKTFHRVN